MPKGSRRVRRLPAVFLLLALAFTAGAAPAAAGTDADHVIDAARAQLGDPWVAGMLGPNAFDCSGLVWFAFKRAGVTQRIGGLPRSADGYWQWFRRHHRASRTHGRRGDLVIWGNGKHVGIYLGRGRAISALNSGVRVHGLHQLTDPFTTFLHVRWRTPMHGFYL
ncbi:MAG: NlpC/P60 family protein [Chloroflexota bacterium]